MTEKEKKEVMQNKIEKLIEKESHERSLKKMEEILIKVGIELARKGEGALFVVSENVPHQLLLKQKIEPFSIFERGAEKILTSIATIDGAVIINSKGDVQCYGALIKPKKVFHGYGTRHSAAYSASLCTDTLAILVSEEERKVKIFKEGKVLMQVDALERGVENQVSGISSVLESIGFGTFSSIGLAAVAPSLAVAILPGILLFGVPYYLIKKFKDKTDW
jgi:DNA integrity scanning protein DisA with diadenylate cyclase activity